MEKATLKGFVKNSASQEWILDHVIHDEMRLRYYFGRHSRTTEEREAIEAEMTPLEIHLINEIRYAIVEMPVEDLEWAAVKIEDFFDGLTSEEIGDDEKRLAIARDILVELDVKSRGW